MLDLIVMKCSRFCLDESLHDSVDMCLNLHDHVCYYRYKYRLF